jgi:hypothetical protein
MAARLAALRRLKGVGLAAATLAGVELAGFYLFYWLRFLGGDLKGPDFFSFYAAARLFLARGGAHFYDSGLQKQFQDQVTAQWPGHFMLLPYIHPPYYTPLIAPLALLDFRTAYLAWGGLNLLLWAAVLVVALRGSVGLRGRGALVGAALGAGFLPLFVTLLQGQSDLVMLLPLAGAYAAWSRGRPGWAGVLAGLALVKPQLLLLVPALFLARRSWRALAGMAGVSACLASFALAVSGVDGALGYVHVVAGWAVGGSPGFPITGQTVYSLRGVLEHVPGGRLPALCILVVLLVLVAAALSWRPHVPRLDLALAIAASVVLSPYQNLHDLSLLAIPGFAVADLVRTGSLRWPGLGVAVLTLGYAAIALTLPLGSWSAAAAGLALAAYLVAERLAVRPEPIPLVDLEWSGPRPHRVIVLPAYRAARTLKETVEGIPLGHADRILVVDDASADATVSVANALHLDVIRHERNLGYGGNQKTCYRQALAMGADVVVMLHPDNQYDPAVIPELCRVIEEGSADIVLGSRWLGIDPAKAGMPWWKRVGNRFLTYVENRVLGLTLSEYHTGYRAYSRRFLETVPFLENSDDFVFDTQILIQAAVFGFEIGEVPAVGRYFEEASSVSFRTSTVYGLKTLAALLRYLVHRAGFESRWLVPAGTASASAGQGQSRALAGQPSAKA